MKKAFVIGDPIAHSKSPLIHRYWLDSLGIQGRYEAIRVPGDALESFVVRLRSGEFAGGNVTIPHKQTVMALCDEVDPEARAIGAVNTLVVAGGRILGRNTDHTGFAVNLDEGAPGWDDALDTAIILGAGGAARAILAALKGRGAKRIVLLNRTLSRAQHLADQFGQGVIAAEFSGFERYAPHAGLLVNTSSVGMGGTRFTGIGLDLLPASAVVNDIVYTPLRTPLLEDAARRGLRTVDGLGMLLHQAVPGFAAWFGVTPVVTPRLRARVIATME